ncbi:3-isopropylmalate dehydratase large subunit [Streptomyces sp. W16]|uniref:3-isopropylmalate dehydratase large subunit n=1 Tax=Streptomyces sp. W16 TaxID=3076631 RepID=UPI00295BA41C|nr:3-isopropylmalate dehydratase large subunit [Streptomyces sp. W16]MDV9170873.1 3-isopropylmalate dehydratase large subunit [Streptomyces sp. W16]
MGRTLAEKIWADHVVRPLDDGADLLYVDLHVLHEVNTPRAFDDLRASGRTVRRPDRTLAVEDHNTPTRDGATEDLAGRRQRDLIRANCAEFGIRLHRLGDADQGIVHVIVPELGLARPGMTIVCCDSHTSTLGALGALAFGIGTAQVEHVLATQTHPVHRPKDLAVEVSGTLPDGATAKDLALTLIGRIGTGGGQGSIIEYRGEAVRALSVEGRMTLCNMSIEAGSRAGLVAADDVTVDYLRARMTALGRDEEFAAAVPRWRGMRSDDDATFDDVVHIDATRVGPRVSWGTNPAQNLLIDGRIPARADFATEEEWTSAQRSLDYMGLRPGQAIRDLRVSTVFLGSCTNGRIEDLREAAAVLDGRRVADGVHLLIVPGSAAVRRQAEAEGLDKVFDAAGADFRAGAGCSMCCALNEDRLAPGERAASTSNRNFEGRQGRQSRTHLVSPRVAAATAVSGGFTTPEDL